MPTCNIPASCKTQFRRTHSFHSAPSWPISSAWNDRCTPGTLLPGQLQMPVRFVPHAFPKEYQPTLPTAESQDGPRRRSELPLMKLLNKNKIETAHFLFLCYGRAHYTTLQRKGWSVQEKSQGFKLKPPFQLSLW